MKILFVNPPLRDLHFSRTQRSPGVIKSGTMYYPYWLAHAAALAEQRGHEIFLMDCPADDLDQQDLEQRVREFGPSLLVMDTSTPSINYDLETCEILKKKFDFHIMLVGTHVTSDWESCLTKHPAVDSIAVGEYDETVSDLAHCIETGASLADIPGVAFRGADNIPRKTAVRLPIENMDSLPWIAPIYKRFLTPENYLFTIARHPMVMLIGGRGCKAKCFYCVYPQVMHGHAYRTRSLEHLIGEMKWIQENMPEVKEIVFEDDTFTADAKRAREFAKKIQEEGIRLPWFANIRTNTDRATLEALKKAGLRECAVGFESGDDLVLANMRKGQTVYRQKEFMQDCRDLNLLVHGCFMVGFPGETKETMERTLELALELKPDSAQFYPVIPYPGTGAYQWAKDNNYLISEDFSDWLNEDGSHRCVLNLPGLTNNEIEQFCEKAFRKFHFRPKYIAFKLVQLFIKPAEGIRSINAGLNFVLSIFKDRKVYEAPVRSIPVDEHWRERVKVPRGRMESIEKVIKLSEVEEWSTQRTDSALLESESSSER